MEIDRKLVGFYSVGPDGDCVADTSQLKYIRAIDRHELPFDLDRKRVKYAQNSEGQFTHFLKYLGQNRDLLEQRLTFACTNALYTLMQPETYYVTASLRGNTIYLKIEKATANVRSSSFVDKTQSWTLKFQQFMQSDTPGGLPDTDKPAFGVEEFIGVYKGTLKEHTIVYTGNIQGVRVRGASPFEGKGLSKVEVVQKLNEAEMVDMHTTVATKDRRQMHGYSHYTSHKFWTHGYLLGTEKMILGYRTDEGILQRVEDSTIGDMVRIGQNWRPQASIASCERILTTIKEAFLQHLGSSPDAGMDDIPVVKKFLKSGSSCHLASCSLNAYPEIIFN